MKTIKMLGEKQISVIDVPMPELKEGRMLAKILASAVCGSERPLWDRTKEENKDTLNFGHEAVCEIIDPNGSKKWKAGDRACIQIIPYCGECYYCKHGVPGMCINKQKNGTVACHSQYVSLLEQCFIPIDKDIAPEIGALLGGDLMGVSRRSTRQLPIKAGEWVLVSGAGPVGLGNIFMLKHLGAKVFVSEPSPMRREFAKKRAGADIVMDPVTEDVYSELMKLTGGVGPEISIECSGNPKAESQLLDWTRKQGHVMFCGENYDGLTIIPSHQIIHKELNVHGTFYFEPSDVPEILEQYRNGLNPEKLISNIVKIEDAPAVMNDFFAGKTGGKVIILPNAE